MGRTVKMQKESVWVVMGPRPINVDARSSDVNNILGKQTPRSCQKKRED